MGIREWRVARAIGKLIWFTSLASASNPALAVAQSPRSAPAIHVSGNGAETYVLISGFMGGVAGFRRLEALLLEQGGRVIVIDPYRLSADSPDVSFAALAKRVDRVLEQNQVTSARLVGHAHGGGVALRLAALNPSRVAALYLLDVGALPSQRTSVFSASLRLVPVFARLPGGKTFIKRRIVRGLRESSGRTHWLDAETQHAYSEPFLKDTDRVVRLALRLARAREATPLATVVSRVKAPTTVLLGDAPHIAGPASEEVDALQPLGVLLRIERIGGAGHFLHEEAPAVVASLIRPSTATISQSSTQ